MQKRNMDTMKRAVAIVMSEEELRNLERWVT